jgi:hypothetical protein
MEFISLNPKPLLVISIMPLCMFYWWLNMVVNYHQQLVSVAGFTSIFQDMTVRMKHGLLMHSFISRFRMVALAFNSYTVLGSNVVCKLCSFLHLFSHLKNAVYMKKRNKYKKKIDIRFRWQNNTPMQSSATFNNRDS